MGINKRSTGIDFRSEQTKKLFDDLKIEDPSLYKNLSRALKDILENAFSMWNSNSKTVDSR